MRQKPDNTENKRADDDRVGLGLFAHVVPPAFHITKDAPDGK